jgi:hypothetical protein
MRCSPVNSGWHLEQMSVWMVSTVEPVCQVLPQAQIMVAFGKYLGWIFSLIGFSLSVQNP